MAFPFPTTSGACGGIDGLTVDLDFFPESLEAWASKALPHGVPFGHDGFGNYWTVDGLAEPEPEPEVEATIFYDCHDVPVLLYQERGMAEFLLDLIPLEKDESRSKIADVHEDRLFDVWEENPGTVARAEALASTDAFLLVDLRNVPPGMGFSWRRYGPHTKLRRFGEERLFAYAPPEQKPGLLDRLFGRG